MVNAEEAAQAAGELVSSIPSSWFGLPATFTRPWERPIEDRFQPERL